MSQMSRAETTLLYSKVVERYAHFFARPEERLRFLSRTLALQAECKERLDAFVARHPSVARSRFYERRYGQLLDLVLYRLIIRELGRMLPSSAGERLRLLRQNKAPLAARVYFGLYRARHVFHAACLAAVALSLFGVYAATAWSARRVNGYLARRFERRVTVAAAQVAARTPAAEALPDYRPEKVWLVERKDNYERYSNGGRIVTDYETENHPRSYVVLPREGDLDVLPASEEIKSEPAGIVYHTSESDMLPFTPDQSDSIEARTRGLLEYVRRNKSYNYLIDRFGQVYRVVRDDHAAHHAGNSVWEDARGLYVGLNESFIGVCFESSMSAGSLDEQLTEAQLVSGRLLTQILRSRHQIDDADCVTHGLVSVNPSNGLISFHHDWARNFPFAAMGLSDKYEIAPPSVSRFGFTYDDELIEKLGGALWPGVKLGEDEFAARAARESLSAEEMRGRMRRRFREQMAHALRLRDASRREAAVTRNQSAPQTAPDSRL
jgi:N-acetylmuramoyl-L-alanine amidase